MFNHPTTNLNKKIKEDFNEIFALSSEKKDKFPKNTFIQKNSIYLSKIPIIIIVFLMKEKYFFTLFLIFNQTL